MTEQMEQAFQDIKREICVARITGTDTSVRQRRIYSRLRREEAFAVADRILAEFPGCSALSGWNIAAPKIAGVDRG